MLLFLYGVFSLYYCLIRKTISAMLPHLKVNKYILFFKKIIVSTFYQQMSALSSQYYNIGLIQHAQVEMYILCTSPLKNYGGFCEFPLNDFSYITIWQKWL